jgi:hypothetical protein
LVVVLTSAREALAVFDRSRRVLAREKVQEVPPGRAGAAALLEDMSVLMAGRPRDSIVFTAPEGGPVTDAHFRNRVWYPRD